MATSLEWLSESVTTTNGRLAVTVAVIGLLLVVLLSYRDIREWLEGRVTPLYADLFVSTLLVGSVALAVTVTVGVWDQTSEITQLYAELDLGSAELSKAIFSFIIFFSTYIVVRVALRLVHNLLGSSSAVTQHQEQVTHRLTQVVIWSVAVIAVLGVWVDDLSGLLVGAGFLGIVVGMAARQTLGGMLAGFVLMFSRPFEIGDWIEVNEYEGIVTDISIINTRIQSADGEYIMIPNDVVGSSAVTNRSKRGRLRLEVEVGVDYTADVEQASKLAKEAVADLERGDIMSVPEPRVVSKSFDESAVTLGVRFWIENPTSRKRSNATTAAIGAIKRRFEAEEIKIPFPQRELSGRAETGGFRVAAGRETKFDDAAATSRSPAEPPTEPRSPSEPPTDPQPPEDD